MDDVRLWPKWAVGLATQRMELGALLPTKDGRRCGNATVIKLEDHPSLGAVATVRTDAGSEFVVTDREIRELFHDPQWIKQV